MKFVSVLIACLLLVACEPQNTAPRPETDAGGSADFEAGARVPVDDHIYTLEVEVLDAPSSLVRQTERGSGSIAGIGTGGGAAYVSGSTIGPEFAGKGFLRVRVLTRDEHLPESAEGAENSLDDPADWFAVGDDLILKTTDTKATALAAGDRVTLRCRAEYEAVSAIRGNESFNADASETWELDLCRLVSPVTSVGGEG